MNPVCGIYVFPLLNCVFVCVCVCLQPSKFEQCLVQMLQSLKEPLEIKPGEVNVRQLPLEFALAIKTPQKEEHTL